MYGASCFDKKLRDDATRLLPWIGTTIFVFLYRADVDRGLAEHHSTVIHWFK
jgi:hypothetical protein